MEPTQGTKEARFTTTEFDKFTNKKETRYKKPDKFPFSFHYEVPNNPSIYGNFTLRKIQTPEYETIVINYFYRAGEWIFLSSGNMIINLDGIENIKLLPTETDTKVEEGSVLETGYYTLTAAELKKIADADKIDVRASGASSHVLLKDKGLQAFHFMCRSFYSEVYNDQTHLEWINSVVTSGTEKKKGGACFIATAATGDCDHPVVLDLRRFRDQWLLNREWGKNFTEWYYKHGPKAAKLIEKSTLLKKITYVAIVKPLQILTKKLR